MTTQGKRLYILSSFTADPLKNRLDELYSEKNDSITVNVGPYNQIISSCLDETSALYKNDIDVLLIWFRLEDVIGRKNFFQKESELLAKEDIRQLFEAAYGAASRLNSKLLFVLPPFLESKPLGIADLFISKGTQIVSAELRADLFKQCASKENVYLIDAEQVIRKIGSEHSYNPAMYAFAKIPYEESVFQEMAHLVFRALSLSREEQLFVVDADVLFCEPGNEQLLNGIEEERIIPDDSNLMNQEYIKELVSWGHKFLLCTSSNENVLNKFFDREDLPAKKEDFAYILTGCKNYEEVIEKIEDTFTLSKEQLIILDTKKVALAGVKSAILPEDPTTWKNYLEQSGLLDWRPSSEIYYSKTIENIENSAMSLDNKTILADNHLTVKFIKAAPANFTQVIHVFESVKEFNFKEEFYDQEMLQQLSEQKNRMIYGIKVEDRFGNYGISGAFIGVIKGSKFVLENLLLNCRILGKKVEYHVLKQLVELLDRDKIEEVEIQFQPNDRNLETSEFLEKLSNIEMDKILNGEKIEVSILDMRLFAEAQLNLEKKTYDQSGHKMNPYQFLKQNYQEKNTKEQVEIEEFISETLSLNMIMNDISREKARTRDLTDVEYVAPRTETEQKVADLWQEILMIESIGIQDNFFAIGGTSLMAAQLIIKFESAFGMTLPVRIFFDNSSIEQMAAYIDAILCENDKSELNEAAVSSFRYKTREFLRNEVWLDEDFTGNKHFSSSVDQIKNVFLTGATGFLGAFMLHDLIKMTSLTIYVLVRADDDETAFKRLIENLNEYSLWENSFLDRIKIVVGDLSKPFLGLSKEIFQFLSVNIDEIYHAGANTNFLEPYSMLKDTNVQGTQEIVRLASTYQLKKIHYVSTHYVFSNLSHENGYVAYEDAFPGLDEVLVLGYQQSKWVGENILSIAKKRKIPVNVYRVGRISGATNTGACQTKDIMWLMIKCCVEAGVLFEENVAIEFIPVDFVSSSIVRLSIQKEMNNKNFHIVAEELNTLEQVFNWMVNYGFSVKKMPYKKWKNELVKLAANSGENELLTTKAMLPFIPEDMSEWDVAIVYDNENVKNGLKKEEFNSSKVDEPVFMKYLDYFVKTGYFHL